jgi:hypothetical protein
MWGDPRRYGERLRSVSPWGSVADERGEQSADRPRPGRSLRRSGRKLRGALTAVSFWLAVSLPFLYLPVLFTGIETRAEAVALATLMLTHVAVLSIGHGYAVGESS